MQSSYSSVAQHFHGVTNERAALVPDFDDENSIFLYSRKSKVDDYPILLDDTPLPLQEDFLEILRHESPESGLLKGDHILPPVSDHSSSCCSVIEEDPMEVSGHSSRSYYTTAPASPSSDRQMYDPSFYNVVTPVKVQMPLTHVTNESIPCNLDVAMDYEEESYTCDNPSFLLTDWEDRVPTSPVLVTPRASLRSSFIDNLESLSDCMTKTDSSRNLIRKQMRHLPSLYNHETDHEHRLEFFHRDGMTEAGQKYADSRRQLQHCVWDMMEDLQ